MGREAAPARAKSKVSGLRTYLRASRDPFNSAILVLPLFVAYQLGILFTGGIRNGVDFMTNLLMAGVEVAMTLAFGKVSPSGVLVGYFVLNLLVLTGFLVVVWRLRARGSFQPRLWPKLLLESTVYALLFGTTIQLLMRGLGLDGLSWDVQAFNTMAVDTHSALAAGTKAYGPFTALVQSIGAGLYEEIVFRAILLGGIFALLNRGSRVSTIAAAVIAIVVSSLIFSAVHHLGSMGDPFTFRVFTFRFFAGVLLSVIFYTRGFAVAVYTHAIYDVIVMVFR